MAESRLQLGELMVEAGFLTKAELEAALAEHHRTHVPLGRVLVESGFASAAAVATALATQHGGVLRTEYGVAVGLDADDEPAGRASGPPPATDLAQAAGDELTNPAMPSLRVVDVDPAAQTAPAGDNGTDAGIAQRCASLEEALAERDARLAELERQLAERETQLADLESRLAEGHARSADLERELESRDEWLTQLRRELEQHLEEHRARLAELERQVEERDEQLARLRHELEERNRTPAEPPEPAPSSPQRPPAADANPNLHVVASDAPEQESPATDEADAATPRRPRGPRIGDLLVLKGYIDRDQLAIALFESKATGVMLGRVLLAKGWIFEEELARCLSEQWGIEYVSLMRTGVDTGVARLLPRQVGIDAAAIPVRRGANGTVTVAFADPTDDGSLTAVETYVQDFTPVVAELSDITTALRSIPG